MGLDGDGRCEWGVGVGWGGMDGGGGETLSQAGGAGGGLSGHGFRSSHPPVIALKRIETF